MTEHRVKIGCLGEVMLELVLGNGTAAELGVAGDTYNTAVYLAHVQPELQIDYITGLGADGFSKRIFQHMQKFGLGSSRVFTHPTRGPGLYAIETNAQGERSFTYWRSAAAARCLGDPDTPDISELLSGLTHLYYSGISLAILEQANRDRLFQAIDTFREGGGIVAFDSNYRPHLWNDQSLAQRETAAAWARCDIGMPSVDDEMALFGDQTDDAVLERFKGYNIPKGTLKRGDKGPISLDGVAIQTTIRPEAVVDTTAAGDSFNAGYLAALIAGQSNSQAMSAGHTLACRVVAHKGAIIFGKE